ncbi:MAG: hypothetical protein M1814_005816 [Vezdaea aestivalis]|nr:MAG: hypothetical protein M1814_005816 [Vezdaea aestivalis]
MSKRHYPHPPTPPSVSPNSCLLEAGSIPNSSNGGLWPIRSGLSPLTAPPSSPLTRLDDKDSLDHPRKRVKFSDLDTDALVATLAEHAIEETNALSRDMPSSQDGQSIRSILKPFDLRALNLPKTRIEGPKQDEPDSGMKSDPPSLSLLLGSAINELCGPSRTAKIDAYSVVSQSLKAHDISTDTDSIPGQLDQIVKCILRDLKEKADGTKDLDVNLAQHAAKLLTILVWTPDLVSQLSSTLCGSIVDHIVTALNSGSQTPKSLVTFYTHIIAHQKFPARVMTYERNKKLLVALAGITNLVKGNGIVGERLVAFTRILRHSPQVLSKTPSKWVDHLLSGLLSSIKEIRTRAIAFGTQAGLALGTLTPVTKYLLSIFDKKLEEEGESSKTFMEFFVMRLDQMLSKDDEGEHVPQIWAVIVLFFRTSQLRIQDWEHFDTWRQILQNCFNSNALGVLYQANLAWNRLIYTIGPATDTPREMIKMLRAPITGQLERKSHSKMAAECKKFAYSSLCNLLYYSFRPTASPKQVDLYWDAYVIPIFQKLILANKRDCKFGCGILAGWFESAPTSPWIENRANETTKLLGPDELPALDPKWVRSRSSKVMAVLAVALRNASWVKFGAGEPIIKRLWLNVLGKLKDATVKDIKTSKDTSAALSDIVDLLAALWLEGPVSLVRPQEAAEDAPGLFIVRFTFLLNSAMVALGTRPFLESKISGALTTDQTAAVKLFRSLVNSKGPHTAHCAFGGLLSSILSVCHDLGGALLTQLDVLRACVNYLPHELNEQYQCQRSYSIWEAVVLAATDIINRRIHEGRFSVTTFYRHENDNLIIIFSWICLQPQWSYAAREAIRQSLFRSLTEYLTKAGSTDTLITFMCRILSCSLQKDAHMQESSITREKRSAKLVLSRGCGLLSSIKFGRNDEINRSSTESLLRMLPEEIDDEQFLNTLVGCICLTPPLIEPAEFLQTPNIVEFLSAAVDFVGRLPEKYSYFISQWANTRSASWPKLEKEFIELNIDSTIQDAFDLFAECLLSPTATLLQAQDHRSLDRLESILCAGFRSSMPRFRNSAESVWERVVQMQDAEVCSSDFMVAFEEIKDKLDAISGDSSTPRALIRPHGLDSRSEVNSSKHGNVDDASISETPPSSHLRISEDEIEPRKENPEGQPQTPKSRPFGSPKRPASKPRVRHNDSQIEFTCIDAIPAVAAAFDLQLLTDHQKDIRKRQHLENALLFSDLRAAKISPEQIGHGGDSIQKASEISVEAASREARENSPTFRLSSQKCVNDAPISSVPLSTILGDTLSPTMISSPVEATNLWDFPEPADERIFDCSSPPVQEECALPEPRAGDSEADQMEVQDDADAPSSQLQEELLTYNQKSKEGAASSIGYQARDDVEFGSPGNDDNSYVNVSAKKQDRVSLLQMPSTEPETMVVRGYQATEGGSAEPQIGHGDSVIMKETDILAAQVSDDQSLEVIQHKERVDELDADLLDGLRQTLTRLKEKGLDQAAKLAFRKILLSELQESIDSDGLQA